MAGENIGPDLVGRTTTGSDANEIEPNEFEQLRAKVAEFLQEAALAHERMTRNQAEISGDACDAEKFVRSVRKIELGDGALESPRDCRYINQGRRACEE